MARGISIEEVTNTPETIQGTEKIPISSGANTDPEIVTTRKLKEYINDDTALTNPEIDNIINNLMTIIG